MYSPQKTPSKAATVIAVVAVTVTLPFGESVIGVQLPMIGSDLSAGSAVLQWVVNAYLVTFAAGILAAGAIGDILGRRRVFGCGLGLLVLGSLVSIFAPTASVLIVARAVSGVAAAMLLATGPALLAAAFPEQGRGRGLAFAAFGAAAGSGIALGPVLGGALMALGSWRSAFALYLPFAGLSLLLWVRIAESRNNDATRLDAPGVSAFTVALIALVFAIVWGSDQGWSSALTLACFAASATLLTAFIWIERRRDQPAVDLFIFRNRTFAAMSSVMLAWQFGVATLMIYVPVVLRAAYGVSPLTAGLAILPLAVPLFVMPPLAPRLLNAVGQRTFVAACGVLMGLGNLGLLWADPDGGPLQLAAGLVVIGLGGGTVNGMMDNLAISTVASARAGMASGVFQTVRIGGAAVAAAVAGSLLASFSSGAGQSSHQIVSKNDAIPALSGLVVVLAIIVFVLTLLAFVLLNSRGQSEKRSEKSASG